MGSVGLQTLVGNVALLVTAVIKSRCAHLRKSGMLFFYSVRPVVSEKNHASDTAAISMDKEKIMYQRILVAVDGSSTSDRALQEAIGFAKEQHAVLRIVHVIDVVPIILDVEFIDVGAMQRALHQSGQQVLDRAREKVRAAGIDAETRLVETDTPAQRPANKIVQEARAWPAELLVIGTHGRRGLDHLLLGSIAEAVARLAPMPVLLIRGE